MKLERRAQIGEVELEERDGAPEKIRGHAAVFNSRSEDLGFFVEIIRPGAFADAIRSFPVVALANHNPDRLLGSTVNNTLTLTEDQRGLYMEVDPLDTQISRDVVTEIRSGALNGQSFSFEVGTDNWRMENGAQVREITKVARVYDVGPVVFPAYPATDVKVRDLFGEAGVDFDGLAAAFVKHFRGVDLTAADRDIVTRALGLISQGAPVVPGLESEGTDQVKDEASQEWRLNGLRRRLEIAARA